MFILAHKKQIIKKQFKIQYAQANYGHNIFTEINPKEYFNNSPYPFIQINNINDNNMDVLNHQFYNVEMNLFMLHEFNKSGKNRKWCKWTGSEIPTTFYYDTDMPGSELWVLFGDGRYLSGNSTNDPSGPWISNFTGNDLKGITIDLIPIENIPRMFISEYNEIIIIMNNKFYFFLPQKITDNNGGSTNGYIMPITDYAYSNTEISLDTLQNVNDELHFKVCAYYGLGVDDPESDAYLTVTEIIN